MSAAPRNRSRQSIYLHLLVGLMVGGILVLGVGFWAGTTELAGAVIAPGVVVVESDVKKVQHPTGGVVGALNVHDGDHVNEGALLVRLDDTQTKANLAVFTKSLDELTARRGRLEAERNSASSIIFPDELLEREATDPVVAHLLEGERRLFELRLSARNGKKAQLRQRTSQLGEELGGLTEQIEAKGQETALIQEELQGVLDLWNKHLVPFTRVTQLKRDAARLDGERGELIATKASTAEKISEVELEIIQVDDDARSHAAEELSDVRAKDSELSEKKIAAQDQLKHIEIRAPQTGRVHQLTIHTVGGVIGPGETIMQIVPENDALSVDAKVAPNDIDQLRKTQLVLLRFSAFSQRTTPQINGTIGWIAAEVTQDKNGGNPYYTAHITVPRAELEKLSGLTVIPGMPVEAFVQTGGRTLLAFLFKPFEDQLMRTFRES